MDKWSTTNISMNIFSTVFELYREIKNPDVFKATIPFDLIKVEDSASNSSNLDELPDGFYENRYYIMNGSSLKATIDTGFHNKDGLVNFNILVPSNKFFKKSHLRHLIKDIVFQYISRMTNVSQWRVLEQDDYDLIVEDLQFYLSVRIVDNCIGLSIVDLKYSGL